MLLRRGGKRKFKPGNWRRIYEPPIPAHPREHPMRNALCLQDLEATMTTTRRITLVWAYGTVDVCAIARGNLALHPTLYKPGWTVTHIPTGYAVTTTAQLTVALRIFSRLAALGTWQFDAPEAILTQPYSMAALDAVFAEREK